MDATTIPISSPIAALSSSVLAPPATPASLPSGDPSGKPSGEPSGKPKPDVVVPVGGCQSGQPLILGLRMSPNNKSIPLVPTPHLRYRNDRGLHVETEFNYPPSTVVYLGERKVLSWPHKNKACVMYTLPGMKQTRAGWMDAHVTVYDGPIGPHNDY